MGSCNRKQITNDAECVGARNVPVTGAVKPVSAYSTCKREPGHTKAPAQSSQQAQDNLVCSHCASDKV